MRNMTNKPIRVGFDLDGVLLYNPARIARYPVTIFKRFFFKKKQLKFYFPVRQWEKTFWRILHWSSLFIAPGFDEIKKLVKDGKIEAYLITGRYSFLENDLRWWLKRMKIDHIFTGIHHNSKDEQPHIFKKRMINKLDLDIFVEDNFDIVSHLSKEGDRKIYWIYNIIDRYIDHPYKFPTLSKAVDHLKESLS